ncbi:histidine kinase, partial [Cellulomonas sp. PS-H5]|nr:histidine kinase [Cellulomonas sp. PS-H5]
MRGRGGTRDRGSASVLVVGLVGVVVLLAGTLGLLGVVQAARGRAQAAADLAALAAAERRLRGHADPCGLAREVAARNGAALAGCTAVGEGDVHVRTTVRTVVGDAAAEALAGPRRAVGRRAVG